MDRSVNQSRPRNLETDFMAIEVQMPQMGESVVEGTIAKWLVKEGDPVTEDQPLVEISTDKVDTEIPVAERRQNREAGGGGRARPCRSAPLSHLLIRTARRRSRRSLPRRRQPLSGRDRRRRRRPACARAC